MIRPGWRRAALAFGLAALLFGPVVWALAARVPDISDTPLAPAVDGAQPIPVELAFRPVVQGHREVVVPMDVVGGRTWVAGADAIEILFATYETAPRLFDATLETPTGACRFVAPPGARIGNNALTRFVRAGACRLDDGAASLRLTLHIGATGRVALWTYGVKPAQAGAGRLVVIRNDTTAVLLRGRVLATRSGHAVRRIALLAFVWSGALGARGIAIWLSALALAFAGSVWIVRSSGILSRVVGAGLAGAVLAATWAVLMPPLQGADEPDHLLSLARVIHDEALPAALADLARRTHFDRIRFHADERFLPVDREQPYAVAWDADVHAEDTATRSPLTAALWRGASTALALPGRAPFAILLRVRLIDALLFGVAVGLAAAIVLGSDRPGGSLWALAPLALIPALPYLATMLSEWAVFVSLTVVWAAGLWLVSRDGPRSDWAGLVVGASFGLLVASGAAALTLAPLIGIILVGRIVIGPGASDHRTRRALVFWGGLLAGLAAAWPLVDVILLGGYRRPDMAGPGGRALFAQLHAVASHAADAPWLAVVLLAAAACLEVACGTARERPTVRRMGRWLAGGVAAAIGLGAAIVWISSGWIAFTSLPQLDESVVTTRLAYARLCVAHFLTSLRATRPDYFLFTTFWSGFGWLETRLPDGVLGLLAAAFVAALAIAIGRLLRARRFRSLGWLDLVAVGAVLSIAAVAVAGYALDRNVHGRYLVGLYVPLVLVAGQGLAALPRGRGGQGMRAAIVMLIVALHAASLVVVLTRYF